MRFSSHVLVVVMALCLICSSWMLKSASANPGPVQAAKDVQPVGVVVEAVTPGSPAEKAGLRIGDVLQWYGARPLRSAFAFTAAQDNTFGVTTITLKGLRANQPLTVQLPVQTTGMLPPDKTPEVRVRPQWSAAVQALYEAGQTNLASGHVDEGVISWQNAIETLEKAGDTVGAGWLCWRMGETYRVRGDWKQAQQGQERAWKNVKMEGDAAAQANVLHALGEAREYQGDPVGAFGWYEQARKLNFANQNVFWEANDLTGEGNLAYARQDWKKARQLHEQALKICQP